MTDTVQNFEQRQQTLTELAQNPEAVPEALETAAWSVLENVLYNEDTEQDQALLPAARNIMNRLATDEELQANNSPIYFNARLATATWGVFTNLKNRGGENDDVIPEKTRLNSIHNLGKFVGDVTGDTFELDGLDLTAKSQIAKGMTLGMLLGNELRWHTYGVMAPPRMHNFSGVDRVTGTTAFQIYGFSPNGVVPIWVSQSSSVNSNYLDKRGVLVITVGNLLATTAIKHNRDMERFYKNYPMGEGQRKLIGVVAHAMREYEPGLNRGNAAARLFASGARHLGGLVTHFDPANSVPKFRLTDSNRDSDGQTASGYTTSSWGKDGVDT